jgi:uncharacterized protein
MYLVKDRSMCDTDTCCSLLQRYFEQLMAHIEMVEQDLYPTLLTRGGASETNCVQNFMNGSQEIKRIVAEYRTKWCAHSASSQLSIKDHTAFVEETGQLFDMVLERLQDESEKLYPLAMDLAA